MNIAWKPWAHPLEPDESLRRRLLETLWARFLDRQPDLALATGADLDELAALHGVRRFGPATLLRDAER